MPEEKPKKNPLLFLRLRIGQIILLVIGLALAIGAFLFLKDFVACWRLTADLPGVPPEKCNVAAAGSPAASQPGAGETPGAAGSLSTATVSAPSLPLPEPWDGASRVTALLIGLDYRDWEIGEGAPRSDTMILLTIDPVSRTGGILTIPRDLWVNIPGFGYGKINTAYSLGEGNNLPGGGGELARRTVENVIGVPIQHWAQVDFATFEAFIDAIGGVKVDVTEVIELDPVGGGDDHVILQPGRYTLDGRLALAYARNRYTSGNDVDRSMRQMQIIMGIRERVTNPTYWPKIAANAPTLYTQLSSGINTTMSFDDAFRLALLAREIPRENIQQGAIDYSMVLIAKSPDGLDILIPLPDKIRELRDQIFAAGGALRPLAQGEPLALAQAEGARLSVMNAAGVGGLAARTGECLSGQGMNVVHVGDPTEWPSSTILIDHSGKPYTLKYLMGLFGVAPNQVRIRFDPNASADVEIILGPGAVAPCP